MKLIKMSAMLVLALAMTVAATGCKKRPTPLTPLPGSRTGTPGGEHPILGDAPPIGSGPEAIPGQGIPLPDWPLDKFNQDRTKFAAFTVYFAFDSSAIRAGERMKIESMIAAMQSDPAAYLLIEGHCDERGTEEYNRSLGERRALSLREELAKAGVNANRIRTLSFGEDKPAVVGHDESAWSKNRRGEFIALTPK